MPPKEEVAQEKLRPLLEQIEAICTEHGINAIAQFYLDASPDDPTEHKTCTFIVGGAKDDNIAMRKLTAAAFQLLGPEGIRRFVDRAQSVSGEVVDLDLARDPSEDTEMDP